MKPDEKLAYLTEKLAAKEKALGDCSEKKTGLKRLEKRLKSEISALEEEIKSTELEVLGDFLNQNGVAFEDIREAVNSGVFDKPETTTESTSSEPSEQSNDENVSPVTREDLTNDNDN